MFQRLSNLLFGEVEEVAAEINGPNPCVTEADEEGWMIVNLPVECMMQVEDEKPPLSVQSFPSSHLNNTDSGSRADCSTTISNPCCKRRRTHKGCSRRTVDSTSYCSISPSDISVTTPGTLDRGARGSLPSSPSSVSPDSQGGCGGSGGSSRTGSERGCMDESWFVTPPPCFTAEGATAEASPMEDLLIEHPSMSVYVSQNGTGITSSSNLSAVGEESMTSLVGSISRVTEPSAVPATCTTLPTRVNRGAAAQAGSLAKVTQMARVQRSKARIERRRLGRNHMQRQNRTREQVPRLAAHVRNSFLHQPCKRNFCH
ncbi:hypothetical protein NQD34_005390 [Periophthalmus magnuspinnatus]|uniref:tumor protein p53-inducible nuclear protein 2 isoform X1 n=1 Tax=Periophthalmus magnuspinnatus TaxID=409849 RepID=UPI00145B38A3|nr:tumor protein p53-inducible nuclear protein 2 isoform X1 [Periophthalmus magnuspinnatus]KAJ0036713.1 hypothetical protein NQD34_005390 [Periophthalmus magnuspinnatus]